MFSGPKFPGTSAQHCSHRNWVAEPVLHCWHPPVKAYLLGLSLQRPQVVGHSFQFLFKFSTFAIILEWRQERGQEEVSVKQKENKRGEGEKRQRKMKTESHSKRRALKAAEAIWDWRDKSTTKPRFALKQSTAWDIKSTLGLRHCAFASAGCPWGIFLRLCINLVSCGSSGGRGSRMEFARLPSQDLHGILTARTIQRKCNQQEYNNAFKDGCKTSRPKFIQNWSPYAIPDSSASFGAWSAAKKINTHAHTHTLKTKDSHSRSRMQRKVKSTGKIQPLLLMGVTSRLG